MSGFSGGSFSFSRSSGHRGGFLGGSHSSGHRGHHRQGGHYRQTARRPRGCMGMFLIGAALACGSVTGLVSLLA